MIVVYCCTHKAITNCLGSAKPNIRVVEVDEEAFVFEKIVKGSIPLPFKINIYTTVLEDDLVSH